MSKLSKFIEHPKWFYKDAFKKHASMITYKIEKINKQFKSIGMPIHINMDNIERNFLNTAVKVTHNRLTNQVLRIVNNNLLSKTKNLALANVPQFLRRKIELSGHLPHIVIKHSFEISINPSAIQIGSASDFVTNSHNIAEQNVINDVKLSAIAIPESLSARAKQLHARINAEKSSVSHGVA